MDQLENAITKLPITRLPDAAMRVLALDTTRAAGSVALVEDDAVTVERTGDAARTHAERLPRELLALLEEGSLDVADVDLFAVAAGPGALPGPRVRLAAR